MKKLGHIRLIDNKVKFEYHELEKPYKPPFSCDKNLSDIKTAKGYLAAMVKYEASKRAIDVNNAEKYICCNMGCIKLEGKFREFVHNHTPCEAEVTDKLATIIKINQL